MDFAFVCLGLAQSYLVATPIGVVSVLIRRHLNSHTRTA
jgi:hypothetical protein